MGRKSNYGWLILSMLVVVFWMSGANVQAEKNKLELFYFYNNPCGSCDVESKFYEIFNTSVGDLKDDIPYELRLYNTFNTEGTRFFQDVCKVYAIKEEERGLPLMIVGDSYLVGEEEIKEALRDTFIRESEILTPTLIDQLESNKDKAQSREQMEIEAMQAIYFYTSSCEDCKKVKTLLDNKQGLIERKNIVEGENTRLINAYFEAYEVPVELQQVPIIFYSGGYLAGYEEIEKHLDEVMANKETLGGMQPQAAEPLNPLTWAELPGIFLTGLVNGFNPCSISMLLFLLSLMSVGCNWLRLGVTYIVGKVGTYFILGTVCYALLSQLEGVLFGTIQGLVNGLIVVVMLILAGANLLDYVAAKQEKYEKIKLQLPTGLRRLNHKMIRLFVEKSGGKYGLLGIMGLSIVVSAGEFLCTGQIYLATIIYLLRRDVGYSFITFIAFLGYVIAMVLPLILIVLLVHRGCKVLRMSEFVRKHMTQIKLINAITFILFALLILYL